MFGPSEVVYSVVLSMESSWCRRPTNCVLIQVPKHVHGPMFELRMMSVFRDSGSGV